MAANKSMYNGVEAIMSAFKTFANGNPYYSVWYNARDIGYGYNENDFEKGERMLEDTLTQAQESGHNDILIIKFHPKQEKLCITSKTPVSGTIYVRVCELPGIGVINNVPVGPDMVPVNNAGMYTKNQWDAINAMEKLPETIGAIIDAKISALGLVDDTPVIPEPTIGSVLLKHLENPALFEGIIGLFQSLIPKRNIMNAPSMVSGIEDKPVNNTESNVVNNNQSNVVESSDSNLTEEQIQHLGDKLDKDLCRLHKYCNIYEDLGLLADYAEKNPDMFAMMLKTLRS